MRALRKRTPQPADRGEPPEKRSFRADGLGCLCLPGFHHCLQAAPSPPSFAIRESMRNYCTAFHAIVALFGVSVVSTPIRADMPTSAEIVDVPSERRDYGAPIGNVRVKFADGHSEFWTRLGRCIHVRCSESGLVGWTRYTSRNRDGGPANGVLRVMVSPNQWKDFEARPYIEDWGFADHDKTVIVKSRGRHGPCHIYKFSLTTGQLIDHARGSEYYANTPDWAKPFADDQPRKATTGSNQGDPQRRTEPSSAGAPEDR